jgi:hypothetical protein
MTETVAVHTPLIESEAVELGNHYWRKQVLKHGDFAYKADGQDRTLQFTPAYTQALAKAYREKAYDAVPFQFAGADNAHTNAIEATRGEIVGFDATADGLDAIFALEPEAEKIISRHPKLPVSVRIIENLDRADSKAWPAAIQHVLATWDPRVTGMRPWQKADLANGDVDRTIDLTISNQEGATMPETKTDQLGPDEVAALRALLTKATATPAEPADDAEWTMPSDEELQRIADALLAETEDAPDAPAEVTPAAGVAVEQPQAVAAANESDSAAIELANERMDRLERDNARLRADADEKAYLDLRRKLADESSIPPAVTDLARPLLTGTHAVELSNGTKVDAGAIVRKMLTEIGEHVKLLDLSGPTVFDAGAATDEATKRTANAEFAKQYASEYGLR